MFVKMFGIVIMVAILAGCAMQTRSFQAFTGPQPHSSIELVTGNIIKGTDANITFEKIQKNGNQTPAVIVRGSNLTSNMNVEIVIDRVLVKRHNFDEVSQRFDIKLGPGKDDKKIMRVEMNDSLRITITTQTLKRDYSTDEVSPLFTLNDITFPTDTSASKK